MHKIALPTFTASQFIPTRASVVRGAIYSGVLLAATGLIGATIAFSAQTAGSMMVIQSAARQEVRPSYAMPLPERKGADFNIARVTAAVVKAPPATVMAAAATTDADVEPAANARPHTITASSLNVRSRPGNGGQTIFSLPRGSVVTVADVDGNWLQVTSPDGRSGWAFSRYLEPNSVQ
jgi:uncharacterized protein YgiM (DUF1202 family)